MSTQFIKRNRKTSDQIVNVNPWLLSQFNDPNIRFVKVRHHGKEAVERNWQTCKNYSFNSSEIRHWMNNGGNYGLTSPTGFACFIDADNRGIQEVLDSALPKTMRWSTGRAGHFMYAYLLWDSPIGCLPLAGGAYLKGRGGYVLGPGSVHPNGTIYGSQEIRDISIATVKRAELLGALEEFLLSKPFEFGRLQFNKLPEGSANIDREEIVRILGPYWAKADGKRNGLMEAITGFIAHSGGSEDDAVFIISKLCKRTGMGCDHVAGARYAFRRNGKPIKGFRSLKDLMEEISNAEQ